jgi:hypothetical protein
MKTRVGDLVGATALAFCGNEGFRACLAFPHHYPYSGESLAVFFENKRCLNSRPT